MIDYENATGLREQWYNTEVTHKVTGEHKLVGDTRTRFDSAGMNRYTQANGEHQILLKY